MLAGRPGRLYYARGGCGELGLEMASARELRFECLPHLRTQKAPNCPPPESSGRKEGVGPSFLRRSVIKRVLCAGHRSEPRSIKPAAVWGTLKKRAWPILGRDRRQNYREHT